MQMRIVTPGRVSAMATSPDGFYCVAAIEEKIHIWQVIKIEMKIKKTPHNSL